MINKHIDELNKTSYSQLSALGWDACWAVRPTWECFLNRRYPYANPNHFQDS
jgi:hypothetical protein